MTDNVDTDIEIKIDSSQVKLDVPGKYLITLSARDKAKNIGKVEVPVYVNDYETHKEYLAAITLEKSQLKELTKVLKDNVRPIQKQKAN